MDVRSVMHGAPFDDSVIGFEWHTQLPYSSTALGNNDEIRIPLLQQDVCVVPSQSYLYVEGKLLLEAGGVPTKTKFVANPFAHMFSEMRYELNGVEIDRVRNPGVATTLKALTTLDSSKLTVLGNAGWPSFPNNLFTSGVGVDDKGYFSFCVPLDLLFGFAEDYRNFIVNARHELILLRSSTDNNAVQWKKANAADTSAVEKVTVTLEKVCWRIPYVTLGDEQRIALLKQLNRGVSLPVDYRSWELHELPLMPKTNTHSWSIKASSQLEKPRYVIVALQTDRKNDVTKNASAFDHCKIENVKLHLNSIAYPYDDLKLDFSKNKTAVLYDMYARFQESYYNAPAKPLLDKESYFAHAPIVVIDCSKQSEGLKAGPVAISLDFEASEAFPDKTSAYCLIIHDTSFVYNPATNMVKRVN